MKRFGDGRDWFFGPRLGMFVHWGLYAINGWHEQEQFRRPVAKADYTRLVGRFNPRRFDPRRWLDVADEAGMEYLCFTTKHIDGFCLWDTAHTPYNVMRTPYGRDVLAELAGACHRRRFPLCLYYSIADMHHPNYPHAGGRYERPAFDAGDEPDLRRYAAFVRAQVRELCTRYGAVHGFWWDANEREHRDPSFNRLIRELQPMAVINNRGFGRGDFATPERQHIEESAAGSVGFTRPTEACQSVGVESWGYKCDEDYYSDRFLMASIDGILSRGGNYLLNVGPRPDGVIPAESAAMLRRIGGWYKRVRESYVEVSAANLWTYDGPVTATRRGRVLYLHVPPGHNTGRVLLDFLSEKPRSAVLLNSGGALEARIDQIPNRFRRGPVLRVRGLPVNARVGELLVVRLEFARVPPKLAEVVPDRRT